MWATSLVFMSGISSFFLGLNTVSFAFGELFGKGLRQRLTKVTAGRLWRIFGLSVLFTGLVQSSSAVTVIGVCLVNSRVLTIADAVALTLGANVGTTVTAQLVSLSLRVSIVWLLLVGLGTLCASLFVPIQRRNLRYSGLAICGLGLLLTGFEFLQLSLGTLTSLPLFASALAWLRGGPTASFSGGLVLTGVVQSSSLVIASTISLIRQGLLSIKPALYVMLGSNVGTSLTTLLAMFGGTRAGKAAALANISFNIISVLLILPFMGLLGLVAVKSSTDPGRQLANAHTIFNLLTAVVVLPFAPVIAGVLDRITKLIDPRED